MADKRIYYQFECNYCQHRWVQGSEDMLKTLRGLGMLRRQKDPDAELLEELFIHAIDKLECERCRQPGIRAKVLEEEWQDEWDIGRQCQKCKATIAAERIEIFPNCEYCAKCQQTVDQGDDVEAEYCPRCGAIMQIRQKQRGGISGYALHCPDCRR